MGQHGIQGMGAGFVPEILDRTVIDLVVGVDDDAAIEAARLVAREDGVLCGISAGAALAAALQVVSARKLYNKRVVVIFPDAGERYASTRLFAD